jgi:tetratricopeptide (TPR) repeat protein
MDLYLAPAYAALASALSSQRRNADAEAALRDGLKRLRRRRQPPLFARLLLAEDKRDAEAIAELERATKLLPGQARIFYNLGLLQQQRGELRPAEDALVRARALGDSEATNALALLYLKQSKLAQALPLVEELAAANPNDTQLVKMRDQLRATMAAK